MKPCLAALILLACSCGRADKKTDGYNCITRENAVLICRADAAKKYKNPTLTGYHKTLCESIYPGYADKCYYELFHEERI